MPLAELRPSRIAGQGLFTTAPISSGTVVLVQDGVGELNHSCDPNLGWSTEGTLVAVREIADGEELTFDYATVIDDADFVMMCHCGTYRCRQVIEGTDWQIPQLQKRYAGHWSPHIQQLIASCPPATAP